MVLFVLGQREFSSYPFLYVHSEFSCELYTISILSPTCFLILTSKTPLNSALYWSLDCLVFYLLSLLVLRAS